MKELKLTAVQNARNKLQCIAEDIFFDLRTEISKTNCPIIKTDILFQQESKYDRCQTIYQSCEAREYILSDYEANTIQALAELYVASYDVIINADITLAEVEESIKITLFLVDLLNIQSPEKAVLFSQN